LTELTYFLETPYNLFAGVENTEENRRAYRELLFTTPDLENWISSTIVFEETLFHKCADGTSFVDVLRKKNIVVGIKVDKGVAPIPGTDGETDVQGMTDLGARCAKYYQAGARFAKWRAVIKIDSKGCPSDLSIKLNTQGLARYAAICQMNGLVPIVEPESECAGRHPPQTLVLFYPRPPLTPPPHSPQRLSPIFLSFNGR